MSKDLRIGNEPVVLLTASAFKELTALLMELVSRPDVGQKARDAYSDFVHEVNEANPSLW